MTKIHRGEEAKEFFEKISNNKNRRATRNFQVADWLKQVLTLEVGEVLEITECCEWTPIPGTNSADNCKDVQYLRQKLFSPELKGQFTTTHSQKICAVWRIKAR